MNRWILSVSLVACVAACTKSDTGGNKRDTMTQRQKDSVLGQSGLPNAAAVTKALTAADSAKARTQRLDSIAADTTSRN